jgi:hypothetical protein
MKSTANGLKRGPTGRFVLEEDLHKMLRGRISGHETKDYILPGKAGQSIIVQLETTNRHAYFTFWADDDRRLAGETRHWAGKLPRNGYYRMRVFLKGIEAKRGGVADYMISVDAT